MFGHIVPCGIAGKAGDVAGRPRASTSRCQQVVDAVVGRAAADAWGGGERRAAGRRLAAPARRPVGLLAGATARARSCATRRSTCSDRLAQAASSAGCRSPTRKPDWLRAQGPPRAARSCALKRTVRELGLVTVCEEAGCPNLSRVLGRRHGHVHGAGRALHPGVRLLPGRHPPARSPSTTTSRSGWPRRSTAHGRSTTPCSPWWPATTWPTAALGLRGRDGRAPSAGADPGTTVEVLITDAKGDAASLDVLFAARPDVLNHNLETVARLQRAVRPSAGYARSLGAAGPGQGGRAHHQVRAHRRHGRDRRRGRRRARRPGRHRRRHRHDRPVPAPDDPPPARRPLGARRRRSPAEGGRRGARASATSRPARSPARATTPSRPPAPSASRPSPAPADGLSRLTRHRPLRGGLRRSRVISGESSPHSAP